MLDGLERERDQICDVDQKVQADHERGAHGERERDVPFRVLDLTGGERDVIPGVGGEKRIGLRNADGDEKAEGGRGGQAMPDFLQITSQAPKIAEVGAAASLLVSLAPTNLA